MGCVHHSRTHDGNIFCRHFGGWFEASRCAGCPAHVAGTALPLIAETPPTEPKQPVAPCRHLGEAVHHEPCSCGAATKIEVSRCHSTDSGKSLCVPLSDSWSMIAGADERLAVLCCETCEHHERRTLRQSPRPAKAIIRVGLASYGHYCGGVEEWWRCLALGNPDPTIQYVAIGVTHPGQAGTERDGIPLVPVEQLPELCELILGWSTDLTHWKDWPGKIVYVAHGEGSWTGECVNQHHGVADAFVAVSAAARKVIDAPDADVTVIDNGVDLTRLITPDQRAVTVPTIGYLGRWSKEKRPHLAAEAASLIGCRAAYLVPEEKLELAKEETARFGVEIDWYITPQLKEFLARISCLVIPSEAEGGPLVAVEAWASGVPVAACPVGMIPGFEAEHGPLVTPLSNPPTTEELRTILDRLDPTITARAYQLAREQLTAERMASQYAALFRRLIPHPASP